MKREKTRGSHVSALIAMQIMGSSLVLGSGGAKQDSWIASLFAVVAAVPLAWMYSAILNLYPGQDFFSIAEKILGGIGGKIYCGIYVAYAVFLGALVIRILNEFIQLVNLPQTPQIAILALSIPLIAAQVRSGLKNLANCAKFFLPIILIFLTTIFLLGLHFMDLNNIRPIFATDAATFTKSTIHTLMLPLGETVLCLPFFGEVETSDKPFRVLMNGILIGGITLVAISLRNLLLLGAPVCGMYLFVSYDAVGIISVGDFITRISVLIGINIVLTSAAKIGSFLYSASLGVSKILNLRETMKPAVPLAALMTAASFTLYDSVLTNLPLRQYLPAFRIPAAAAADLRESEESRGHPEKRRRGRR